MFEWLFPGWQNPAALAAIVGLRALCNASIVVLLVRSLGTRHPLATIAAGLAVFSTALTVLLLRPGGPGLYASYVELAGQALLLALAGAGLYRHPSARRAALGAALVVPALLLSSSLPSCSRYSWSRSTARRSSHPDYPPTIEPPFRCSVWPLI